MTLRNCPNCNAKVLDDEAKFCIECGANLSAEKSSPPAKVEPSEKSAVINVTKGQRVDLTKTNPDTKNFLVGLGWNTNSRDDMEINAAAFLLGANGKVTEETDFIFYNNPVHDSESVENLDEVSGDDSEQFSVAVDKIPPAVTKVAFTLTIHDAAQRQQNFGQVSETFIRVADPASGREILRCDLGKNFSSETAVVVAELYRHKDNWKFNAICAGFSGGLSALCKNFGINI